MLVIENCNSLSDLRQKLIDGEEVRTARQELCDDTISRQAAQAKIKSICDEYRLSYEDGERKPATGGSAYALGHAFDDLPPVTPQLKMGRWIYDYTTEDGHRIYHCSECGCYLKPKHSEPLNSFKWCSLCGAKMVESEESEEV